MLMHKKNNQTKNKHHLNTLPRHTFFFLKPFLWNKYFGYSMQCRCMGYMLTDYGNPYPEPVYTGLSSVHWNATGMPLTDPVCTGIPLGDPANTCRVHWNTTGKFSWNCPTLECHWWNWLFQPTLENHWRDPNSPHTPRHIELNRVAAMPV